MTISHTSKVDTKVYCNGGEWIVVSGCQESEKSLSRSSIEGSLKRQKCQATGCVSLSRVLGKGTFGVDKQVYLEARAIPSISHSILGYTTSFMQTLHGNKRDTAEHRNTTKNKTPLLYPD
jgi:hypothetical protein